ncbi:serine hydrolase [Lacticaseibacillus kribbianus]|uniref:serine hydrolase n=1 Tax=Lacticaseibacillus kribbianus TaxID=2926292 RepID=UPI001CD2B95E|nr:serine hydrolase [Lacticaseibacillus kribbianus]
MKKFWRGLIVVVATLSVWAGVAPVAGVQAATDTSAAVSIDASAALAVEAKTGKIMYAKNADKQLPIASMTKMLSLYLVLDAIKSGKLSWNDKVAPDAAITKISQDTALSNVPLRVDATYTVKELYSASFIYSANAAMMLLGNAVAGSQSKFVDRMTAQLEKWGIKDAHIVNATGLPNSALTVDRYPGSAADDENSMTAKDVAIVARHLLDDFPEVLETTTVKTATFRAGTGDATRMDNYDWMLPGLVAAQKDLPVDGLKTGTTDKAGDCFTGTVEKNGMRIITVVLHANGTAKTRRFDQTAKLMRYTLSNWKQMKVTTAGQPISGHASVKVDKGKLATVPLAAAKTVTIWVPTGTTTKDLAYNYKTKKLVTKNTIEAPVNNGTTVATTNIAAKADTLGYLNGDTGVAVSVHTAKAAEKANFFVLLFRGIGEFFHNLF